MGQYMADEMAQGYDFSTFHHAAWLFAHRLEQQDRSMDHLANSFKKVSARFPFFGMRRMSFRCMSQ